MKLFIVSIGLVLLFSVLFQTISVIDSNSYNPYLPLCLSTKFSGASVKMLVPDPAMYGLVLGASLVSSYKVVGRPSRPSCIAT